MRETSRKPVQRNTTRRPRGCAPHEPTPKHTSNATRRRQNSEPPLRHPRRPRGHAPPSRRRAENETDKTNKTNTTLQVKGLHSDASNEGSDDRERRHHRQRPRPE